MTGFDLLNKLSFEPYIVFITAYDEFAIKAFEYYAIDYLLKPYSDSRFEQAIDKVKISFENRYENGYDNKLKDLLSYILKNNKGLDKNVGKIPIRIGKKIKLVNVDEISHISASGYYAELHTMHKKYILRESLSILIQKLSEYSFVRIHRSTIVNLNFVEELIYSDYGEIDILMKGNQNFRVSKRFRQPLMEKLRL
jgi:two-component system LytT family response regulator